MKSSLTKLIFALMFLAFANHNVFAAKSPYYYQIKVYHLKTAAQESMVDSYLKDAYLPALHRFGIDHVGVFKPVKQDSLDQLIYVFIPFKKIDGYLKLDHALMADEQYQTAGKNYLDASFNNTPYVRIESILLKAFDKMPSPEWPKLTSNKSDRIYELRSYEAATEKLS